MFTKPLIIQRLFLFAIIPPVHRRDFTYIRPQNNKSKNERRSRGSLRSEIRDQRHKTYMAFFNSAVGVLQTLVIALGAGLGIWGAVNLLEGYGNDNPGAKSQGMKQLMAGGGVALIGIVLVPQLAGLFG